MTALLDLVRAAEELAATARVFHDRGSRNDDATMVTDASLVRLAGASARARITLDHVANAGMTEVLAELMWQSEALRAQGVRRKTNWEDAAVRTQDVFRNFAKVVLTSGLVTVTPS